MSGIFNKNLTKSKISAFSLVQLLVVTVMIGILSAIMIPYYNDYIIKSKVVQAIGIIKSITDEAAAKRIEEGSFSSSMVFSGINLISHKYVDFDDQVIKKIYYSQGTTSFLVCGWVKDIRISGQSDNYESSKSILCYRLWDDGLITKTACGHYRSDKLNRYIPIDYLPRDCKCTNIRDPNNMGCL